MTIFFVSLNSTKFFRALVYYSMVSEIREFNQKKKKKMMMMMTNNSENVYFSI